MSALSDRRPRLLVLNQYYWPGVEATAHLLTELCEALAGEYDVTVVTGRLRGHERDPQAEERNGVRIVRVHSTAYDRAPLSRRAANYMTYLTLGALRALVLPRPDVVLCMTDPPMVGDVALVVARRFGAPLVVVSEDVFPEIAVELGRLRNPALVGLLGFLTRYYLRNADRVVAIGETMERRLQEKGADPERMRVIPNWVDTAVLTPQPRDNDWARGKGLAGRFVAMHSGNIGHAQDLDNLIRATTFLRDLEDFRAVIIGFGARYEEHVALAARIEADVVRFLPYQPRDMLARSLSAADVHFVGLSRGLAGYVVPSRLYGILAVGRPVIAAAEADSETARVVDEVGCGIVIPPGRPDQLARVLRELHGGEHDLEEMGRRGREYVEAEADREVAVARYADVLAEVRR
ncbi:MAG TPA: glycosyltransferase family 4 protein [Gaiellaceae bacterium]|jgi:glycosyltransferase involved in cell wall biosynthesis